MSGPRPKRALGEDSKQTKTEMALQSFVNRWNNNKDTTTVPHSWFVYKVNKFSRIDQWDTDSASELLDLCSSVRIYTDLYYKIDTDMSEWGVNQSACKMLANYLTKFV